MKRVVLVLFVFLVCNVNFGMTRGIFNSAKKGTRLRKLLLVKRLANQKSGLFSRSLSHLQKNYSSRSFVNKKKNKSRLLIPSSKKEDSENSNRSWSARTSGNFKVTRMMDFGSGGVVLIPIGLMVMSLDSSMGYLVTGGLLISVGLMNVSVFRDPAINPIRNRKEIMRLSCIMEKDLQKLQKNPSKKERKELCQNFMKTQKKIILLLDDEEIIDFINEQAKKIDC